MLKRVLVPLDGSKRAEAVLAPMAELLGPREGTLILLHAVSPAGHFAMSAEETVRRERRQSAAYLSRLAERLAEHGPGIEERVVAGEASRVILSEAKRAKAGLIAISSHGRSGIREWAFGSVAERVLRGTDLPVLVFRGPVRGTFRILRIAVALDGSRRALEVLEPVAELASALHASVDLLHVGAKAPETLRESERRLRRLGVATETLLLKGEPAPALLAAARARRADVLAITPTGRSQEDRVFFGSVAEAVLKKADLPLLVRRAD
jgi:nucleotide-binding universal stress UspA family protein